MGNKEKRDRLLKLLIKVFNKNVKSKRWNECLEVI